MSTLAVNMKVVMMKYLHYAPNSNLYSNLLLVYSCRTSKEGNLESPEMDFNNGGYWGNGSNQRVNKATKVILLLFPLFCNNHCSLWHRTIREEMEIRKPVRREFPRILGTLKDRTEVRQQLTCKQML